MLEFKRCFCRYLTDQLALERASVLHWRKRTCCWYCLPCALQNFFLRFHCSMDDWWHRRGFCSRTLHCRISFARRIRDTEVGRCRRMNSNCSCWASICGVPVRLWGLLNLENRNMHSLHRPTTLIDRSSIRSGTDFFCRNLQREVIESIPRRRCGRGRAVRCNEGSLTG